MKTYKMHVLSCLAILLATAAVMNAQTTTTTTTLFAQGLTAPAGGVVLSGSGINPNTGKPYRHFWGGDELLGLCRFDPDLDSPGPYAQNRNTCMNFVGGVQFKPGELAFDATSNTLYAPNITAGANAVYRLHFLPDGDTGQGNIDPINVEILISNNGGHTAADGCPTSLKAANSAALGPDGNLYVASKGSGSIVRVIAPATQPLPPCTNVQNQIATSPDGKKNFGLGWIGHTLFGGDGLSAFVIPNADQCFTPANNFKSCQGQNILVGQIPAPTGMISDQTYPQLDGANLYYTNGFNVILVTPGQGTFSINTSYGTGFQFAVGLAVDKTNPAAEVVYVGDDPSAGNLPGSGRWWQISAAPPAPAAPGTPTGVTASAGDAQATVSWTPAKDGQQIDYAVVHNSFASNGTVVPDLTVNPNAGTTIVPTSATVTGLTNGVSYQFEVQTCNSLGCSPLSAASNTVTPQALTVPSAPTNVAALAGSASATVAWTASANNGGSTITSYTVTALVNGVATGITATAPGTATGAAVSGLTDGTTYTFTVHATNAVGNSAESAPSNAVTPTTSAAPPDMAVTISGPASVSANAQATYTVTVVNNGPSIAPQVILTNTIPAGTTMLSQSPSQGVCSIAGTTGNCNLGSIAAGGSASVSVIVQLASSTITVTSTVQANDANGNLLADPNTANNTASFTTTISAPTTTTDIQVTGSAQNGGPAVGTADTYTWQIKNNKSVVANAVTFTDALPPSLQFASVSTNLGSCSGPAPGSAGGTVNCTLDALNGGQTMIVTVNVTVTQAGSIANTGSANFSGTDSQPSNNTFTVTISAK